MSATSHPTLPLRAAVSGPGHLLLGFRLLLKPGVRGFMLIPLAGNILFFVLAAGLAFYGLDLALDRWLPAALDWLRWLLFPLVSVLLLILSFLGFTLLGNLVLAPFNGLLSARVEQALTGQAATAPEETVAAAMRRSLKLAAWRFGFVVLRLGAVFLLGLVPVIGVIAVPLGIGLGAWLLALEFSDPVLGNWGWNLAQQRDLLRRNRAGFIGFGLAVLGASLVPFLNLALIPAAVAGMTAYCVRLRDAGPERAPRA
jgi:CysZ protein